MSEPLFDVVGVSIATGAVRVMTEKKTRDSAESFAAMAVYRRGVEEEFFAEVPAGTYREGDHWRGVWEEGGTRNA